MFSAFFISILISLASGVGLELSDTVEKLFVSVHNDKVKIEVNNSPVPTVAALFTTTSPSPTPTVTPSPMAASGRFTGCDFEYHKTATNGEPIDFHYNCTQQTEGGGNVKNTVDVSISTN